MATTPATGTPVYRHITFARCGHTTRVNVAGWEPWRIQWTEQHQLCVHCHRGRPAPSDTAVSAPAPAPAVASALAPGPAEVLDRAEALPRAVAELARCAVGEQAREAALPRLIARLVSLPGAWWGVHGAALLGDPAGVLDLWAAAV